MVFLELWLVFAISAGFGGVLGGLVYPLIRNYAMERRFDAIEQRFMGVLGSKSQQKQSEMAAREEQAIGEVLALFQAGKDPQTILKEVGVKYPDIAMKYAKKLM